MILAQIPTYLIMGAVVLTSVAFSLFFAWLSLHGLLRLLSRMSSARR